MKTVSAILLVALAVASASVPAQARRSVDVGASAARDVDYVQDRSSSDVAGPNRAGGMKEGPSANDGVPDGWR